MRWTISRARHRLSELIRSAARGPQAIYNRDRLVAFVVDAERFEALNEAAREAELPTLGQAFAVLRAILSEEGYELTAPERVDRPDEFPEVLAG